MSCLLVLSVLTCSASCGNMDGNVSASTGNTVSIEESLRENFGNLYDGLTTGIPMEGDERALWKLNGDTLVLFGEGAFLSTAASFFPWRNVSAYVEKLRVSAGVTAIGSYGFYGYDGLTEVTIEDGCFGGMGMGCFGDNKNLKTVDLGDSLSEIPAEAFVGCVSLEEIAIPATVTRIGIDAFLDCESLKTVHYGGSEEDWGKITVEDGNEALRRAQIVFGR